MPVRNQNQIDGIKTFKVTVYIYSGGGYADPAYSTALPSFEVNVKTKPPTYFSEEDINSIMTDITKNGYLLKDEETDMRTLYPPNRISHVEAEPMD